MPSEHSNRGAKRAREGREAVDLPGQLRRQGVGPAALRARVRAHRQQHGLAGDHGRGTASTPVSARTYSEHGFPWFSLYDEGRGDLAAADALKRVKSVREMDGAKGFGSQQDDAAVEIGEPQVVKPRQAWQRGRRGRLVTSKHARPRLTGRMPSKAFQLGAISLLW